jgi:hypothetical protein
VKLNAFVAQKKRAIFDELFAGNPPSEGRFDEAVWKDGKAKGQPQMGSTQFAPDSIILEFIFNDPQGSAVLLQVVIDPPQRIVFMPVPEWVVESIWQGEITGSYHFESEAEELLNRFQNLLSPEANAALFGPQMAKRRE